MNLEELKRKMDEEHYIYDDTLSTVLYVALQLGRPLLIEGAAGVGKTEVAKVMAAALDRELVRLQCYEGLDESKALYEWNYQKQLLSIQVNMNAQDREALTRSLFSDEYLLERPLLKSIRSEKPVVLLIDEIDKADEEFEAFLGAAVGNAGDDPGGGNDPGKLRPLRGADLQPGKAPVRSPAAAVRLSVYRVPGYGKGAGHSPGEAAPCGRPPLRAGGAGGAEAALQRGHSEKALHCGDAGLGGGAGRSRHPGADP